MYQPRALNGHHAASGSAGSLAIGVLAVTGTAIGVELAARLNMAAIPAIWSRVSSAAIGVETSALAPHLGLIAGLLTLLLGRGLIERMETDRNDAARVYALGIAGRDIPFLLAGMVFVALYASFADLSQRNFAATVPPGPAPGSTIFLMTALAMPLAQELLLRGSLLPVLESRIGAAAAIILAALPSLVLQPPHGLALVLAVAPQLFFGWAAWSCRSLGASAILHVTYMTSVLILSIS